MQSSKVLFGSVFPPRFFAAAFASAARGQAQYWESSFFMFFVHTSLVIHAESPACSLKSLRASGGLDGIDAGFCGAPGRCA